MVLIKILISICLFAKNDIIKNVVRVYIMAPVIHTCSAKCPPGHVCVCKKKRRKKKKTVSKGVVAGAAVKVAGVQRAVPTQLLLERQSVDRLIKNAKTAGLEVNQGAYDNYMEDYNRRATAARYGIPSVSQMAGVRARRALSSMIQPRGHAPARERSQTLNADPEVMAAAAEARVGPREEAKQTEEEKAAPSSIAARMENVKQMSAELKKSLNESIAEAKDIVSSMGSDSKLQPFDREASARRRAGQVAEGDVVQTPQRETPAAPTTPPVTATKESVSDLMEDL
jgi:hypothetical protein